MKKYVPTYTIERPISSAEEGRLGVLVEAGAVIVLRDYWKTYQVFSAMEDESGAAFRAAAGDFRGERVSIPLCVVVLPHCFGAHEKTNDRRRVREWLAKVPKELLHLNATVESIEQVFGGTS